MGLSSKVKSIILHLQQRRIQTGLFVFGYDQLAQFQLLAGDVTVVSESIRSAVVGIAQDATNLASADGTPVGVYHPVKHGNCFAFGVPITVRENFSGREGLRLVVVIYIKGRSVPNVGELLTRLRVLEACICQTAGYSDGTALSYAACTLGGLLQGSWDESARSRFVSAIRVASSMTSRTHGAPISRWAYPVDVVCGNIATVICDGASSIRSKQVCLYLPYGADKTSETGLVTACYYGLGGAYVSTLSVGN